MASCGPPPPDSRWTCASRRREAEIPSTRGRRPAEICRQLLAALDAAEGRRRKRKRDTTPDAIGLDIKRELLAAAVREDPSPEEFEGWLLERSLGSPASGAVRAMAQSVLAEWRLALESESFRNWLGAGAPSDDAGRA